MIHNKIGREDEQIHLEILSIFAQKIGKTIEDFFSLSRLVLWKVIYSINVLLTHPPKSE